MNKRRATVTLIVIAALIVIIVYGLLDPANTPFPRCPFNLLTGLKCPGCGSQRALHQLLHLNIAQAFRYNACLVAFIPVMAFLLIANSLKAKCPRIYYASHNPVLSWTILAVILLWFVLRNIFSW